MSDIKPNRCPKCGRPKPCIGNLPCGNWEWSVWYVWCPKCCHNGKHAATAEKAVILWNEEGGAK